MGRSWGELGALSEVEEAKQSFAGFAPTISCQILDSFSCPSDGLGAHRERPGLSQVSSTKSSLAPSAQLASHAGVSRVQGFHSMINARCQLQVLCVSFKVVLGLKRSNHRDNSG